MQRILPEGEEFGGKDGQPESKRISEMAIKGNAIC
jgi:hypothetical protein